LPTHVLEAHVNLLGQPVGLYQVQTMLGWRLALDLAFIVVMHLPNRDLAGGLHLLNEFARGMKYVGAYLMAATSKEEVTEADVEEILKAGGCEIEPELLKLVFSKMDGLSPSEVLTAGLGKLEACGGGGGGGGGGAAAGGAAAGGGDAAGGAAAAKEEEPEEEEDEMEFDLFD